MSDTPPPSSDDTPPDSDLLRAAEYVLGLLEPAEAETFEARLATDPALRALTAAWADDLVAITDTIPEAQVPDHVWQALQARLWPKARAEGGAIPRSWRGFIASLGLGSWSSVRWPPLCWLSLPGSLAGCSPTQTWPRPNTWRRSVR